MSPSQVNPVLLTDTSTVYICLLIGGIGLLVLAGVVVFGTLLYRGSFRFSNKRDEFFWEHLVERWIHGPSQPTIRPLIDASTEHLQRRNEFWTSYGQTIVAVLIIIVLTILLLTRTISAEAGLAILSGISGFAIAKSVSASRPGTRQDPNQRG